MYKNRYRYSSHQCQLIRQYTTNTQRKRMRIKKRERAVPVNERNTYI